MAEQPTSLPPIPEMLDVVMAAPKNANNDFVQSFAPSARSFLSRHGDLTTRQYDVLVRLWREVVTPPSTVEVDGLSALRDLFGRASGRGLKRPSITVTVDDCELELSRAPDHGKNPGCIYVKVDGNYAGKVFPDNQFRGTPYAEEALPRLIKFGQDPAGVAAASGHLTGRCSFCNRKLTDERSTFVGYGATCADNYGLPWGEVA